MEKKFIRAIRVFSQKFSSYSSSPSFKNVPPFQQDHNAAGTTFLPVYVTQLFPLGRLIYLRL